MSKNNLSQLLGELILGQNNNNSVMLNYNFLMNLRNNGHINNKEAREFIIGLVRNGNSNMLHSRNNHILDIPNDNVMSNNLRRHIFDAMSKQEQKRYLNMVLSGNNVNMNKIKRLNFILKQMKVNDDTLLKGIRKFENLPETKNRRTIVNMLRNSLNRNAQIRLASKSNAMRRLPENVQRKISKYM